MSELALQLIREAKEKRLTRLDLGRCGLTELPDELFYLFWLEELILSNIWNDWDDVNQKPIIKESANSGLANNIRKLTNKFDSLISLKRLYCSGDNRGCWYVHDLGVLSNISNLEFLSVGYLVNTDYSFLEKLKNLRFLDVSCSSIRHLKSIRECVSLIYLNASLTDITGVSWLSKLKNFIFLDLSHNKITKVNFIKKNRNLRYLNLNNNYISDIDELHIEGLEKLIELDLSFLKLKEVNFIKNLRSLEVLKVAYNNLEILDCLNCFDTLRELSINNNNLSNLDFLENFKNISELDISFNKFSNIDALENLEKLKSISLRNNKIKSIGKLKILKDLEILDVSYNSLIDYQIVFELHKLKKLYARKSGMQNISGIEQLSLLEELDLSNNWVRDTKPLKLLKSLTNLSLVRNKLEDASLMPLADLDFLIELNISENKIADLSVIPKLMKRLKLWLKHPFDKDRSVNGNIIVQDNPIINPPIEVLSQGQDAIIAYFDALESQGGDYLNEAKLIIVGEPAAGKTSLMECLWNPDFKILSEAESQSTLGIEVREGWEFPHPEFKGVQFTTNIWDFGGQHIQYMTHQFFLTPNAVYVLVSANDRKESTNFPYWFKIINLLGQDEGRYSPVIVVLNEKDQQFAHKFNFDRSAVERQYPHIPLKVCEVNLSKRDNKFAALEQTIQEALANLPLVKAVKPAAWQPIREALREKAQTCDYINFKEYVAICEVHGVAEERQQLLFSRYLHRLGNLLHFENDSNLVDFIILNPQWAVDAVYAVITDNRIEQNKGYFTRDQVEAIWLNKKDERGKCLYSKNERASLFSLMQKENFEICYALHNRPNEFIAPQLLSPERPSYEWDDQKNLKFRYQYAFMPEGIIARLIVRLSDLIKQHNSCDVVWRQGMLLEDKAKQCNALIQEAEIAGLKVIDIAINGNAHQRKYLLYDIRTALNELHKRWFSNIQVEAMIPCNCRECSAKPAEGFYFKFSALKTAQEKGKFVKECDKSCIDVPILSLLEGIYKPEEIRYMNQDKSGSISITVGDNSQVNLGANSVQKKNSDNYTVIQTLNIEQRQQLSELIKVLRTMDLSDDEMDVVDAARQVIRADEKQTTPETQGKLAKMWHGLKEFMDVSNNTIGVTTAAAPLVIEVLKATVL